MNREHTDLFGSPTSLIGLRVKLDRPVDRERPCCNNVVIISAGKGPHVGEAQRDHQYSAKCSGLRCAEQRGRSQRISQQALQSRAREAEHRADGKPKDRSRQPYFLNDDPLLFGAAIQERLRDGKRR